jgi:F-box-like
MESSVILEKVNIEILPIELKQLIFSYLPYKWRINAEKVCKQWRDILRLSYWPVSEKISIEITDNQPADFISGHMIVLHNSRNPDYEIELLPVQGNSSFNTFICF